MTFAIILTQQRLRLSFVKQLCQASTTWKKKKKGATFSHSNYDVIINLRKSVLRWW